MSTMNTERLRTLYSELSDLQSNQLPFEERFFVLTLDFPIEELLQGEPAHPGRYHYCLFVNQRGVRHLRLTEAQAEVAAKMKLQLPLTLEEKTEALHLLRNLAR